MEDMINELHPYIVQGLGALILAIFAAMATMATLAVASLRSWLTTKNLIGLRSILDDVVNNAAKELTPEKIDVFASDAAERLAEYFSGYVKRTAPDTLAKIGFDDAQLNERMMKEAAQFINYTKGYIEQRPNAAVINIEPRGNGNAY